MGGKSRTELHKNSKKKDILKPGLRGGRVSKGGRVISLGGLGSKTSDVGSGSRSIKSPN